MDAIVTLVSLDHPWLPVYTGLPPLSEYPWMPELLWYPWTIHGYQCILVYPPCQSIRGCYSYSGIPGPSMVTSVYWSTPLVRVSVDARVTLVSQDHPVLLVYTGLPPCQSIRGCHSYCGIPGPSMVTSIYWSTPLSEYPWIT